MEQFDNYASQYREIHDKNLYLIGLTSDYFAEKKVKIIAAEKDTNALYKIFGYRMRRWKSRRIYV